MIGRNIRLLIIVDILPAFFVVSCGQSSDRTFIEARNCQDSKELAQQFLQSITGEKGGDFLIEGRRISKYVFGFRFISKIPHKMSYSIFVNMNDCSLESFGKESLQ